MEHNARGDDSIEAAQHRTKGEAYAQRLSGILSRGPHTTLAHASIEELMQVAQLVQALARELYERYGTTLTAVEVDGGVVPVPFLVHTEVGEVAVKQPDRAWGLR